DLRRGRVAGGAVSGRRDRTAACELAGVVILAEARVEVIHCRVDQLLLVTELEGVLAAHPGEVDFGVVDGRPLELRAGRLITELREAGNGLCIQRTAQRRIRWEAVGDAELRFDGRLAGEVRGFATLVAGPREAEVQQLVCADCPGCAAGDLAVLDVNVRVGVAAGFAADGRRIEDVALMLAVAAEDLPFAVMLVDTNVALVIVDSAARSIRVVVGDVAVCDGTSTNVVRGEIAKHSQ